MSLVTYILGFFGIELGKKSVTFADDTTGSESAKSDETKEVAAATEESA